MTVVSPWLGRLHEWQPWVQALLLMWQLWVDGEFHAVASSFCLSMGQTHSALKLNLQAFFSFRHRQEFSQNLLKAAHTFSNYDPSLEHTHMFLHSYKEVWWPSKMRCIHIFNLWTDKQIHSFCRLPALFVQRFPPTPRSWITPYVFFPLGS